MPHPTATNLQDYVTSLGILEGTILSTALSQMDATGKINAAIAEFEEQTGWAPFLAGSSAAARYFDPPGHQREGQTRGGGRVLELDAGLVELTSVYTDYSITSAGALQVVNSDFYLTPRDGVDVGKCTEAIEFVEVQWGDPRSIKITGKWGRVASLPNDVYQAELFYAAHLCRPQLALLISRGLEAVETQGFKTRTGAPLDLEDKLWLATWNAAVLKHRRVIL